MPADVLSDVVPSSSQLPWGWAARSGCALLLCAALLLVWRSSLDGDFQFDDYGTVVENRAVRSIWPLDEALLTSNRPVGLYTFALSYHVSELSTHGYHVVNLLIHVANALLLFSGIVLTLSRSTLHQRSPGRSLAIAFFAALLWGVHPLTTQAVTNIVQRYESLATLGYLAAWVGIILVARGVSSANVLILAASWVGLLTKETFATAPLVIALYDRCFLADSWKEVARKRWLAYLLMATPFVWFIPSVLRWFDPTRHDSVGFGLKTITWWEYLRTQPEVILHYLRLSVWPSPLCFDYVWRKQHNPAVYLPLGAAVLVTLGGGIYCLKRGPLAGFLILAFFLILAPTSSFMPIADLAVEHRMYLPLAVVVVGLVFGSLALLEKLKGVVVHPRIVWGTLAVACAIVLSWRTGVRNRDYRDGLDLWKTVLAVRPDNPRAHYMLGAEYLWRQRLDEAYAEFQQAVASRSPVSDFYLGMGECERQFKQLEKAAASYTEAIRLKPTNARAHNGLGVVLHQQQQLAPAKAAFEKALELDLEEAPYNLAAVLLDMGDERGAIPHLERSIQDHPRFDRPARRLAWILSTSADPALRNGPRAIELLKVHVNESTSPYLWDAQAAALAETGDFTGAEVAAKKAINLAKTPERAELKQQIEERLMAYSRKRPWRSNTSTPKPTGVGANSPANLPAGGGS